jgi:hypothetical protein
MVTFNEKCYTIHVDTGYDPVENWILLHNVILELVRTVNTDNLPPDLWVVTDFLAEMMPDIEVAKKMIK